MLHKYHHIRFGFDSAIDTLLNDFEAYNIDIDTVVCGIIIQAFASRGMFKKVQLILDLMRERNISINLKICHNMLHYFVKFQKYDVLPQILELVQIAEPNLEQLLVYPNEELLESRKSITLNDSIGISFIITTLIESCFHRQKFQHVFYYIKLLNKFHISPTPHFYTVLMKNLRIHNEKEEMLQILDYMRMNRIEMESGALSSLLSSYHHTNSFKINQMLSKIVHTEDNLSTVQTLTAIMFAHISSQDYYSAFKLFNQICVLQDKFMNQLEDDQRIDPFSQNRFIIPMTGLVQICLRQCRTKNTSIKQFWTRYLVSQLKTWIDKGMVLDRMILSTLRVECSASSMDSFHLYVLQCVAISLITRPRPCFTAESDFIHHCRALVRHFAVKQNNRWLIIYLGIINKAILADGSKRLLYLLRNIKGRIIHELQKKNQIY
jgi:pentatricopeptide repeat protein